MYFFRVVFVCASARDVSIFFIKPFKWGNIDLFYYYRAGKFTVVSILFHFWFVMVFFLVVASLDSHNKPLAKSHPLHWHWLFHIVYTYTSREFFNFKQITRASALHRNNIFIVIGLLHFQMNCTLTNRCDTISFQAICLNYALALLDG